MNAYGTCRNELPVTWSQLRPHTARLIVFKTYILNNKYAYEVVDDETVSSNCVGPKCVSNFADVHWISVDGGKMSYAKM